MMPRSFRQLTAWMSLFAAFLVAIAPGISRLVADDSNQQVAWLCTSNGFVKVVLATGEQVDPASGGGGHASALDHCQFCGLSGLPVLPSTPAIFFEGSAPQRATPVPCESDPPAAPVWANARARAPPSLG